MLLPHFKGALTQNFSGEIMSEIDLSERTNLWNIKGKYSIGHIQNKVRHMPRDWARQTRLRRIQCGSHVNKPIAWVYIGWLLAHVLCYCAVCATCGIFLRVSDCVCTARQCGAPSSMVFPRPFCVLTWPAVFTLPAKLLLPIKTALNNHFALVQTRFLAVIRGSQNTCSNNKKPTCKSFCLGAPSTNSCRFLLKGL